MSAPENLGDLPAVIPLFPLAGVVLFPGARLPLHIFEPRYRRMLKDAVDNNRVIGLIQPVIGDTTEQTPALYRVGGLGRIDDVREEADGRSHISLWGLSRFEVVEELAVTTPYRQARVRYLAEGRGLDNPDANDRALLDLLGPWLESRELGLDDDALKLLRGDMLVLALAMVLPLEPAEKQALLEKPAGEARAQLLTALIEMDTPEGDTTH